MITDQTDDRNVLKVSQTVYELHCFLTHFSRYPVLGGSGSRPCSTSMFWPRFCGSSVFAAHLVVLHVQFFLLALQLVFQVLLLGDVVLDLDHSHVPLWMSMGQKSIERSQSMNRKQHMRASWWQIGPVLRRRSRLLLWSVSLQLLCFSFTLKKINKD